MSDTNSTSRAIKHCLHRADCRETTSDAEERRRMERERREGK